MIGRDRDLLVRCIGVAEAGAARACAAELQVMADLHARAVEALEVERAPMLVQPLPDAVGADRQGHSCARLGEGLGRVEPGWISTPVRLDDIAPRSRAAEHVPRVRSRKAGDVELREERRRSARQEDEIGIGFGQRRGVGGKLGQRLPDEFQALRYPFIAHGTGMVDEYPCVKFDDHHEGELEVGMVMSVEAYVGAVGGSQGVKLEEQIIIGADGPEMISEAPYDERLLG
jgi:hypothetical protein